jgi:hypothetical protein
MRYQKSIQSLENASRLFPLLLLILRLPVKVKINSYNQHYMHCNIYTTDAQNLLLSVSALHGCHHQGVFTVVTEVL